MKRSLFIALTILAVSLAACGVKSVATQVVESPMLYGAPADAAGRAPMPAPTAIYYEEKVASESLYAQAPAQQRLVIRNADLAIVIADPNAKMAQITAMAESMGGFVVTSNMYQTSTPSGVQVPQGSITIRVPAAKLTQALDTIKADAVDVQYENISGQDVTQDYVDLKSRLHTYEEAEIQLEKIMAEKTSPEEVLNVFNQMMYYREQIEVIKGQMQYYEQASALSAISVQLIAEETIQPLEIAGWQPKGVARDAIQDLIYFLQDFVDFLIKFFLNYLPKLILIFGPLGLIIWGLVRLARGSRRKSPPAPKQ